MESVVEADSVRRNLPELDQPAHGERDDQPESEAEQQRREQPEPADVLPSGQSSRLLHQTSISVLAVCLAAIELIWLGLLGFGVYLLGQQLF